MATVDSNPARKLTIEVVARGSGGARGCVGPASFLAATVDQTPRDFSPRVLRHALHALGGHQGSYIPSVRHTTI